VNLNVVLLVLHVCMALAIISLILLQKGKGASEGATFGGGASTVFGASGSSNFLSKTTAILATGFFINSLALAYLAANRDEPTSVVDMIGNDTAVESVVETVDVPAPEALEDNVPMPAEVPTDSEVPPAAE
jgi:preprotein translocase subunit SecG